MTTRLQLICHGSTSALRTSAFPADEPLDAQGLEKAARSPLRRDPVGVYLCSPALRAIQTAQALDLPVVVDASLRDADYGRWAGRTLDEVQAAEPEAVARWLHDPGAAPHGGETLSALIERVAGWLLAQRETGQRIVAVTHAAVIRAAIVHALEAPPRSFWRIDVAPLSTARLTANGGRWTLASLGRAEAP